MYTVDKKIIEIRNRISDEIISWSLSKEKFLNIISPPYNFCDIFLEVIVRFVRKNKRVLYITNESKENITIINSIKKYTTLKKYVYYEKGIQYEDMLLIISSHNNAREIKKKFDLVIYDDIKSFSINDREDIIKITLDLCKELGRIIAYSIEKVFFSNNEVNFPIRKNCIPIIEPKFIETRIDINKDIPYVAYEYIKWSITNNHKVIIYVPDQQRVFSVYNYLYKYFNSFHRTNMPFINNQGYNKLLYSFKEMQNGIIITNDFDDLYFKVKNINVMVFFADDIKFDYKKLVYLCGKVGINQNRLSGEVVFLGNYETDDIDKAKYITRCFNKMAWEMELLKI
ncbi:hypothetical protein G8S49_06745 [Clostridium botulinum C]|uniref:Comf operon protein A, DNA transporter ATPase n=3 Tax=Clostridium TaxID=1485 RepID=A0A9Q4TK34_CLOBO|nr:hypothetical protein [Clostridium botulinum]MCD3194939.1 hypothetical protein [Clostridium botulinum C]MCD3201415.1 hypothetical protein [Clostridium botulinum C]MCD3206895.1 hypothetical protein [Clostridium botulinum C]MCD3208344.1 hypothetical protein [Clostridium botulinum C]MCD3225874.1 hypothetical protein [Clostridium botulinum C]